MPNLLDEEEPDEGKRSAWFVNWESGVPAEQSAMSKISRIAARERRGNDYTFFRPSYDPTPYLRSRTPHPSRKFSITSMLRCCKNSLTLNGVMIDSTDLFPSSRTALSILSSSSLRGSCPSRWSCRRDLSSAFLYVCGDSTPRTQSSRRAIGYAIGAGGTREVKGDRIGVEKDRGLTEEVHHS
jgi:hypothetical protein